MGNRQTGGDVRMTGPDDGSGFDIADEALCVALGGILDGYPALRSALPSGYPSGLVTVELMRKFDQARRAPRGHWHLLNLAYALYLAAQNTWPDARDVGASVLATLDRFCSEFHRLPGFTSATRPLKKGIWKADDPEFWSVLAQACVALLLHTNGFHVKGFSAVIPGGGQKDADILVSSGSTDVYVDIVMKHRPKFATAEQAREELRRHADEKIGSKFADSLPGGITAMVIVVCVPQGVQLGVFAKEPSLLSALPGSNLERPDRVWVNFFAMAGVRGNDDRLSWQLLSRDKWATANVSTA